MYPDKRACEIIDEILQNGITHSTEISKIFERDYDLKVEPHFIAEYKYRKMVKGGYLQ